MTALTLAPVDDTADLLDLIANDPIGPWTGEEWADFKACIARATVDGGRVDQTRFRDGCRTAGIFHKRMGPFTRRACSEGLIVWLGEWEPSTDTASRNAGKPVRVYRRMP